MLVRVRLALADVALRGQLLEALADPHCYVIAEGTEAAPGLVNESFDLAVLDRAALAQASDLLQALRALPDRPTLVVLDEGQDDGRHATLVAAGADAVLEPGPGLVPALRALVERSRERRLERHQAGLRERRQPVDLIANSPAMRAVMETVHRVAYADSPVLIQGETGVGKERIAAAIHGSGPRAQGPFVSVNCAALPAELFESELFGHAKGAFTGAHRAHRGQFERADRGVLLLDEIGEVPLPLQAKLLRAIQDQRIRPVGADEAIEVDVRIVAATNRDLEAEVEAGRFRRDLFYRLCVVEIMVPSLRERPEDIAALADAYLQLQRQQLGRAVQGLSEEARVAMMRYPWPGNVRELANVMERAVLLCRGSTIELSDLPTTIARYANEPPEPDHDPSPELMVDVERLAQAGTIELPGAWTQHGWKEVRAALLLEGEREYLTALLAQTHGRVGEVARRAGISARALFDKMRRHGLRKEDFRPARSRAK
ncbi:MAG: sigma-54-dependent Fis family transcriptional regulator [Myxococcales bacterium]|nr:sigma-54-dependent Fis family transcriptional regulator [Myxococcales bacterium]MCB9716051.1 sigma-54-dependent Fis family transcriptional regulator [Myxococcales bacterium]